MYWIFFFFVLLPLFSFFFFLEKERISVWSCLVIFRSILKEMKIYFSEIYIYNIRKRCFFMNFFLMNALNTKNCRPVSVSLSSYILRYQHFWFFTNCKEIWLRIKNILSIMNQTDFRLDSRLEIMCTIIFHLIWKEPKI